VEIVKSDMRFESLTFIKCLYVAAAAAPSGINIKRGHS